MNIETIESNVCDSMTDRFDRMTVKRSGMVGNRQRQNQPVTTKKSTDYALVSLHCLRIHLENPSQRHDRLNETPDVPLRRLALKDSSNR